MEGPTRGMPLLSGPPPTMPNESNCRRCNKEFNVIFARSKKCQHCGLSLSFLCQAAFHSSCSPGYSYCSSNTCSGHQALMPRSGSSGGYDVQQVCSFCIEMLMSTFESTRSMMANLHYMFAAQLPPVEEESCGRCQWLNCATTSKRTICASPSQRSRKTILSTP
jgi:hypothetical protein